MSSSPDQPYATGSPSSPADAFISGDHATHAAYASAHFGSAPRSGLGASTASASAQLSSRGAGYVGPASGYYGMEMAAQPAETAVKPPKLDKKAYEEELERLQAELVEMQQWVVETGARVVIIMEGRDAAGKGSAIKRITQYLNPRTCRVEALPAPNSREQGQWYFQRYIEKLPTAGEIVIFDRSWYNRAGVERVMGFCTTQEYRRFLHQAPIFERLLVEDGILLRKYWFSVSDDEQIRRFTSRQKDPLRQWKLSPMDLQSITRWEDYSRAKDEMFVHTDIPSAPWYTVESEDKKRSRINVINHILNTIPWEYVEKNIPSIPERPSLSSTYIRPPRAQFRYVPDAAGELEVERVKEREAVRKEQAKAEKQAAKAAKEAAKKAKSAKKSKKSSQSAESSAAGVSGVGESAPLSPDAKAKRSATFGKAAKRSGSQADTADGSKKVTKRSKKDKASGKSAGAANAGAKTRKAGKPAKATKKASKKSGK